MQFYFRETEVAKRAGKRLKNAIPGLKLSQAQQIVARMFGYKSWFHMQNIFEMNRQNEIVFARYSDDKATQRLEILADRLSRETGISLDAARSLLPSLVPGFLIGRKQDAEDTD